MANSKIEKEIMIARRNMKLLYVLLIFFLASILGLFVFGA